MAAQQLAKIDPLRSRGVSYERAWRANDFARTATLYAEHQVWPDRTHRQQAQMLARRGQFDAAKKSLQRILDPAVREAAEAELPLKTKG